MFHSRHLSGVVVHLVEREEAQMEVKYRNLQVDSQHTSLDGQASFQEPYDCDEAHAPLDKLVCQAGSLLEFHAEQEGDP